MDNPYAPPSTVFAIVPSVPARDVGFVATVCAGALVGFVSFVAAMALIPADTASPTTHDLRLANHLGFIYPPLLGCWAGWVRRSIPWVLFGIASGLAIGLAYYLLCGTDFLAVMVGFPCLLGGATSVLLGTKHANWFQGIPQRFIKGLVAGFALGFCYMFVLNVVFPIVTIGSGPTAYTVAIHSSAMWTAGTIAMTIASAVYFVVFHWSAGLMEKHDRITIDDDESPTITTNDLAS